MADLGREEEGLTGAGGSGGGSPLFSDTIRLMQRPRLVQQPKVDGGGRGRRVGRRKDEDEAKRHEGENGKTPWPYL